MPSEQGLGPAEWAIIGAVEIWTDLFGVASYINSETNVQQLKKKRKTVFAVSVQIKSAFQTKPFGCMALIHYFKVILNE